jgi:hypothetical protein
MAKGFDDDLFRFVNAQKTSAKKTGIEKSTTSTTVPAGNLILIFNYLYIHMNQGVHIYVCMNSSHICLPLIVSGTCPR